MQTTASAAIGMMRNFRNPVIFIDPPRRGQTSPLSTPETIPASRATRRRLRLNAIQQLMTNVPLGFRGGATRSRRSSRYPAAPRFDQLVPLACRVRRDENGAEQLDLIVVLNGEVPGLATQECQTTLEREPVDLSLRFGCRCMTLPAYGET